jgi:hypothetical protein
MVMEELWQSKLQLKVKNFMWVVHMNRLQTADNLGRKQGKGSKFYQFCQAEVSVDHLMFECPITVLLEMASNGEMFQKV